MPNGVYPVPKFHPRSRHAQQPARLRLRLWWNRTALDEQLAAGAQPKAGTLLYHRAEQLSTRPERYRLASELQDVLHTAHTPAPVRETGLPLRRGEVRATEEDILALVRRLKDDRPVDIQGIAMVVVLLADPSGPLYRAGEMSLRYAIRSARLSLDHTDEFAIALPEAA